MSKRKYTASVSHTEETIRALRADRELAVEYLKAALAELDDPANRAAGLLALRDIAEACDGHGVIVGPAIKWKSSARSATSSNRAVA